MLHLRMASVSSAIAEGRLTSRLRRDLAHTMGTPFYNDSGLLTGQKVRTRHGVARDPANGRCINRIGQGQRGSGFGYRRSDQHDA